MASVDVKRRLAELDLQMLGRRALTADAARDKVLEEVHLERALQSPDGARVVWLRAAADQIDVALLKTGVSACSAGCSSCCEDGVIVSGTEAAAIADVVGVRLLTPKRFYEGRALLAMENPGRVLSTLSNHDRGRGPCPFLQDGRCGIYADRPIQCRLRHNLDVDSVLCAPVEGQARCAPMLSMEPLWDAIAASMGDATVYADIREWFGAKVRSSGGTTLGAS